MKNIKIIAFILLSVFFTIKSYSQEGFSIHVGPTIPMGDFGSGNLDNEEAGGAAIGLNVGMKYLVPLSETGLGVFGGVDLNYNGLKGDVKDNFDEMFGGANVDVTYFNYINVPISAGLNYTYQADNNIGIFVNAGLVVNYLKITDMEVEYQGQTAKQEMDLASKVGFKIGGGILINPKTSISVDYFGLGEHDVSGVETVFGETEDIDSSGKVDFLTLTIGFKL